MAEARIDSFTPANNTACGEMQMKISLKRGNWNVVAVNNRNLIHAAIMFLLCLLALGCSDSLEAKNRRLFSLVNTSFANDAKTKEKYRYAVASGTVTGKARIDIVCKCSEMHLDELKGILNAYQPEMKYRRGPYGTSRLVSSADLSLLAELKELINAYERLLSMVRDNQDVTIENVHEYVVMVNLHKHNFYGRARELHLMK